MYVFPNRRITKDTLHLQTYVHTIIQDTADLNSNKGSLSIYLGSEKSTPST